MASGDTLWVLPGLCERCGRVARRFLLGEVRAVRCWGGEDELSARWGAGNVSSRPEQGKTVHTHPPSVYRRLISDTHIKNGQLISPVWLSAAFFFLLIPIHECLGSIPRPPLGLKWDDMGFFMSTKIGGILAFALGKISEKAPPWFSSSLRLVWQRKTASHRFISLHQKCHCCNCNLYLSPSVLGDGYEICTVASCLKYVDHRYWVSILRWCCASF